MVIEDSEFNEVFWDIYNTDRSVDLRQKFGSEFKDVLASLRVTAKDETNRMVRYIIYMYDKNSPLRKKIKKIEDRKMYAAKLSGYSEKVAESKRKRILEGTDVKVVSAICDFVQYINDYKWAQLIADEQSFWSLYGELMAPLDKNKSVTTSEINRKKAIRKEIKDLEAEINNLEYDIFGGDQKASDSVKELRKMKTSPEAMAMSI